LRIADCGIQGPKSKISKGFLLPLTNPKKRLDYYARPRYHFPPTDFGSFSKRTLAESSLTKGGKIAGLQSCFVLVLFLKEHWRNLVLADQGKWMNCNLLLKKEAKSLHGGESILLKNHT